MIDMFIAIGVVVAVAMCVLLGRRTRTSREVEVPTEASLILELLRRVHRATTACIVVDGAPPVLSSTPRMTSAVLERQALALARDAAADGREHVDRADGLVVAWGGAGTGCAVALADSDLDATAVQGLLRDIRLIVGGIRLARRRPAAPGVGEADHGYDWLLPRTVDGLASALCDRTHEATGRPCAIVVRDPATNEGAIAAVSAGTDRRLLRATVSPTSVVGRVSRGDLSGSGVGGELFGSHHQSRRRREDEGSGFCLEDGTEGVGAIVVFGSSASLPEELAERVRRIAKGAGPLMGRALAMRAARDRTYIDELTGQPNRLGLARALDDHAQSSCSLLSVELDQYSDLDEPAAAAAVRHVARVFRRSLRDYDVPAREDGHRFALFLPDTPFHHAFGVADRVRQAVSESIFDWAGQEQLLTCTFGVASVPESARSTDTLLDAAHAALFEARLHGGNRVSARTALPA